MVKIVGLEGLSSQASNQQRAFQIRLFMPKVILVFSPSTLLIYVMHMPGNPIRFRPKSLVYFAGYVVKRLEGEMRGVSFEAGLDGFLGVNVLDGSCCGNFPDLQ